MSTLYEAAVAATETFHTFDNKPVDLVQLGIKAVDKAIGGLAAGSAGILAAATGAGKSSIKLSAALEAGSRVGLIELEDTPDVVGTRVLSAFSGVDSRRIRTKNFFHGDKEAIKRAIEQIKDEDRVRVEYAIGGPLDRVHASIRSLAEQGCRLIWVDYIQKIRGGSDDRRNEVSFAYTTIQRVAAECGVAVMVVSQFSRQPDPTRKPRIWWLKESGDLENEARLILLCQRDADDIRTLHGYVAKSTVGGEGTEFVFTRDDAGFLREVKQEEEERF